jgi:cysteinyl-tRNA synthetase
MGLDVFNTLTRTKDRLVALDGDTIRLFVCGPTVYDWAHIGHAKTYTQFDFVARYLRWRGLNVDYLQNITDIDDKIIDRAAREARSVGELAELYEQRYREDMSALGNTSVTRYARASDHIESIVRQIGRLHDTGHAYELPDGHYFDISTFDDYGKLSRRRNLAAEDAVARIDENPLKRQPGDFALWKARKPGEPFWATSLGEGRPGWHIEDTAITEDFFGPQYDIHGGAVDLIFPHHEAEIAQMESISGQAPLARYWMHTGFLKTGDVKMSKSLGNTFTVRSMLDRIDARQLRFLMLSYHYRSSLDFTEDLLDQARGALRRIDNFYERLDLDDAGSSPVVDAARRSFFGALDNDFDVPSALAALFEFIRGQHRSARQARGSIALLEDFYSVTGIVAPGRSTAEEGLDESIDRAIVERERLRRQRLYAEADAIRDALRLRGVELEDTAQGVRWHRARRSD